MGRDEDDSPFAHTPAPGIYETPTPITPMAEVAAYGTFARGLKRRSRVASVIFAGLFLVLIVGGVLFGIFSTLFRSDDDSLPNDTPPSTFVIQTAPPTIPVAPPPTSPPTG